MTRSSSRRRNNNARRLAASAPFSALGGPTFTMEAARRLLGGPRDIDAMGVGLEVNWELAAELLNRMMARFERVLSAPVMIW